MTPQLAQLSVAPPTKTFPGHAHCALISPNGNTTYDAGHSHAIVNGFVQPGIDGHTHQWVPAQGGLGPLPCQSSQPPMSGAGGKPCNCGRK